MVIFLMCNSQKFTNAWIRLRENCELTHFCLGCYEYGDLFKSLPMLGNSPLLFTVLVFYTVWCHTVHVLPFWGPNRGLTVLTGCPQFAMLLEKMIFIFTHTEAKSEPNIMLITVMGLRMVYVTAVWHYRKQSISKIYWSFTFEGKLFINILT